MNANLPLEKIRDDLQKLSFALQKVSSYFDKLAILNTFPLVQNTLRQFCSIQHLLKHISPEAEFVIKSIFAISQGPVIFNQKVIDQEHLNCLALLLQQLIEIETFYQHMGGIIGYHLAVISLIIKQKTIESPISNQTDYIHPEGLYLDRDQTEVHQAVRWGIENLEKIAMIYPLGGAGDRLNLQDEKTGISLPAACLPFLGRTLLEGLIRDLQAQEYLAFKLLGKQLLTPIAIMTSVEKNNHAHILQIGKACNWFGRPSSHFYFFTQPVVPVITMEGNWSLLDPLTLNLKPGGHGVIWKLAEDQQVFKWLEIKKRHQCLIRQINNPLAGIDHSLLALMGIGCHEHKAFGFVSCERLLNSEEGTNVLIETQKNQGYDYCLTNIEYTDFAQKGIGEFPAKPNSPYSIYPTNTNILFADINSVRQILKVCAIPGQLINMKSKVPYIDSDGQQSFVLGGRLESTMQNIADFIVDNFPQRLTPTQCKLALRTFIVYNVRSKTISTTKKSYKPGEPLVATPEQAYYDLLSNHYKLLQNCQFELPQWRKIDEFLTQGPPCILLFHPALGPLYSLIAQKIRKGHLTQGAELQLEIAEVDIEDLLLEGSLLIESLSPLGTVDSNGLLIYGQESRCTLKQVTICNQGINHRAVQCYWKNEIKRQETVKIVLHEGAEFHAENIVLTGSYHFEVPAHHRLVLQSTAQGKWTKNLFPIQKPTWSWHYTFDAENTIQIKRKDYAR